MFRHSTVDQMVRGRSRRILHSDFGRRCRRRRLLLLMRREIRKPVSVVCTLASVCLCTSMLARSRVPRFRRVYLVVEASADAMVLRLL